MLDWSEPDEIGARITALGALLESHRTLWIERPFVQLELPWEREYPHVGRWLRSLSHAEIDALESDPLGEPGPRAMRGWAAEADSVSTLSPPPAPEPSPRPPQSRVPERKRHQIEAFARAVSPNLPQEVLHIVDWCAGKGHLSRELHRRTGRTVTALERQASLCAAGEAIAGDTVDFQVVDVMHDAVTAHVPDGAAVIGLHACGVLTDRLLDVALERDAPAAFVAPCCYHRLGGAPRYLPRSKLARDGDLHLLQENLRLATAHEVVARGPIRAARRRELAWRLGFDLLVREASGVDTYVEQGKFEKAAFDLPFEEFCRLVSERRQRSLPPTFDAAAAERAGWERGRHVRALGIVRGLFRRSMELWLVLDRVQRVIEAGRAARLAVFCPPALTPRNLVIAT